SSWAPTPNPRSPKSWTRPSRPESFRRSGPYAAFTFGPLIFTGSHHHEIRRIHPHPGSDAAPVRGRGTGRGSENGRHRAHGDGEGLAMGRAGRWGETGGGQRPVHFRGRLHRLVHLLSPAQQRDVQGATGSR